MFKLFRQKKNMATYEDFLALNEDYKEDKDKRLDSKQELVDFLEKELDVRNPEGLLKKFEKAGPVF